MFSMNLISPFMGSNFKTFCDLFSGWNIPLCPRKWWYLCSICWYVIFYVLNILKLISGCYLYQFFCNPVLFIFCASTFSKLCKNICNVNLINLGEMWIDKGSCIPMSYHWCESDFIKEPKHYLYLIGCHWILNRGECEQFCPFGYNVMQSFGSKPTFGKNMPACYYVLVCFSIGICFDPDDGGNMLLQNVVWLWTDHTALCPIHNPCYRNLRSYAGGYMLAC
jgi:hypothetical protein